MVKKKRSAAAIRKADKLRKQQSRLQIVESFKFIPPDSTWRNQQLHNLFIPHQFPDTAENNQQINIPLTPPKAVRRITGDGNCLFRALSYALSESEDYHMEIRSAICNFMRLVPDDIKYMLPNSANGNVHQYLATSQMECPGVWGTEVEILTAAVVLQANIYVYSQTGVHWRWIKHSPMNSDNEYGIYLFHKDGNHFEVVVAVENSAIPSNLPVNLYYNPHDDSMTNYRNRKAESAKKVMNKKCELDQDYRAQKSNYDKNKYANDPSFSDKKRQNAKNQYSNPSVSTKKKQTRKNLYSDPTIAAKLKQLSRDSYLANAEKKKRHSRDSYLANAEKKKRQSRDSYLANAEKKKGQSRDSYLANAEKKKGQSRDSYLANAEKKKRQSRDSYLANAEKKKRQSRNSYLANAEKKKRQSRDSYLANAEKKKRQSRDRYHSNDDYRSKKKQASVLRYCENTVFRNKLKILSRQKYKSFPAFREKLKANSKNKYQRFSVFRNNLKAASIKKYATCPLFRLVLKKSLQTKYHNSAEIQEQKKDRVKASRKLIHQSVRTFKRTIGKSPKYVCRVCIRLLYRKQVKKYVEKHYYKSNTKQLKETAEKCFTGTFSHVCDNMCTKSCWMKLLEKDKNWICHTCDRHLRKGNMPPQALANNLFLSKVPELLAHLNVLERQLVSLRIPFMKMLSLPRGGQKGVKGPVVNVPSDISSVTSSLPRNIHEAQLVKVKLKRKTSYKGHYTFKWINPVSVVNAIKYLKDHNLWYQNVSIHESWLQDNDDRDLIQRDQDLNDISDNESIEQHLLDISSDSDMKSTEAENDSDEESVEGSDIASAQNSIPVESCFQPIDMGQEILDSSKTLCIAPAENQTPQNIFLEDGSEAMAFPTLLPDGHFGLFEKREIKLSPSKYFNARLFSADNRFASNKEYLFFAQYVTEINRVSSNISLALRQGKQTTDDGQPVTASMLMESDRVQNILKSDVGFRFLQPIRGTPPYWQRTMKDLYAMIHQIGIPTWFVTFSAAETRWPDVMETLLFLNNDDRQPADLDWQEKCSLIADNPVICARMFDHRVKALFSDLIMSPSCPIGQVIDYFYRTEFQQRGSPHIHCLFWIKDAPKLGEDSDEDVCRFIDQYISCRMPDKDLDPELFDIISVVQIHSKSHTKSCTKYNSTCRFNFPRPPIRKTFIARAESDEGDDKTIKQPSTAAELDQLSKAASRDAKQILREIWILVSSAEDTNMSMTEILQLVNVSYAEFKQCLKDVAKRNTVHNQRQLSDIWVNNYNEHLSRAWNANIDIQFVTDAYACVAYILSYISKAETEMGDLLQNAKNEAAEGNADAASALKKIASVYMHNREVSAQEAIYRVCGLHLKQCTREVMFIPAGSNIFRMSLPLRVIKSRSRQDAEDQNIWMVSLHEKYYARPHNPAFNDISLAEFVSKYFIIPKSQKPKSTSTSPVLELQNDLGYIKERKPGKEAVIRYPRFKQDKNPEDYYLSMLQLFLPHRKSFSVPTGSHSYEDFVKNGSVGKRSVINIIEENRHHFEINTEELEKAWEDVQEGRIQEESWGSVAAEAEVERLEAEREKEDVIMDESEIIPELTTDNHPEKQYSAFHYEAPEVSEQERQASLRSMNNTQQQVFYKIRDWTLQVQRKEKPEPFFVFLTGGAGTGKSHLIRCLYHETTRILSNFTDSPDSTTVLLTAPTGTAAFNIQGMTIHSAFAINKNAVLPYKPLGENILNTLRSKFGNLKILIIDEISMVDQKILSYIHGRLCQINHTKQPFGNVSILAVGDFYQLPPVKGLALYKRRELDFLDLWNGHFSIVVLTEIMRQKDDCKFANMLNRIRTHIRGQSLMQEDLSALENASRIETPEEATNALHIFPTNKEVNMHNQAMIGKVCKSIYISVAKDYYTDVLTGRMRQKDEPYITCSAEDLQTEVQLGIGARIMLTRNLDIEDGLVNGAFGSVVGIDIDSSEQVAAVFVKFDNSKIGRKCMGKQVVTKPSLLGSVKIKLFSDTLCGRKVTRKQLPLKLAWGATIHKVQGMTVEQIVVSLKNIFQPGMAYVALSRATSLAGLYILEFNPDTIYCSENITEALNSMQPFLSVEPPLQVSAFVLLVHNTQGLIPHIEDIKTIKQFHTADVICLTETWLLQGQTVSAALFPDHKMYNMPRSEAFETNHDMLRKIATMDRGGVSVFVKNTHLHTRFNFKTKNLEAIGAIVNNVVIVTIYRSQSYNLNLFIENVAELLREIEAY